MVTQPRAPKNAQRSLPDPHVIEVQDPETTEYPYRREQEGGEYAGSLKLGVTRPHSCFLHSTAVQKLSDRRPAAVDHQVGPGDVRAPVGGEIDDGALDVFVVHHAADGAALFVAFPEGLRALRGEAPRRDGVDAQPGLAVVSGQRAGQVDQ